jgi:hypothetical protein
MVPNSAFMVHPTAALDLVAIREGFVHRHLIDIFQITADRHAHRNARDAQTERF